MRRNAAAAGRATARLVALVGRSVGASKCNDLLDFFKCGQHKKWIEESVKMELKFYGFNLLNGHDAGKLLPHHGAQDWV